MAYAQYRIHTEDNKLESSWCDTYKEASDKVLNRLEPKQKVIFERLVFDSVTGYPIMNCNKNIKTWLTTEELKEL